jgi:hypothetical protein
MKSPHELCLSVHVVYFSAERLPLASHQPGQDGAVLELPD